ncbi:unnamed protein product [Dovyalis caffra]|uniref:CRAL-TRIO domain-containing protein n=1 Tax=Dovyalis caffra TaxID=77055 RepID=A0AAV1QVB5_9ROSI|nr:unnamed protein product [Dovyalis caffra]
MGTTANQDQAIKQFQSLMDQVDESMKNTYQNMHQGYPTETLVRFLKARDWNVAKAHKMKPIIPTNLYRAVRDSQLLGLSGYSKEGLPIIAIGAGLSTFDKASSHIQINEYRDRVVLPSATKKYGWHISTCLKVLDMTGLKLSALNHLKLLTTMSTIDDLNYPEKTDTYYIVNAPYIFSACWKVVKPLLQERTRRKIQVLQGCGRDELLKIMDYSSLPHFCRKEGSGSSKHAEDGSNCFSSDHAFHQQLYGYMNQQAGLLDSISPIKQGSVHVDFPDPDPEDSKIAKTIETELHRLRDRNGLSNSLNGLEVNGLCLHQLDAGFDKTKLI